MARTLVLAALCASLAQGFVGVVPRIGGVGLGPPSLRLPQSTSKHAQSMRMSASTSASTGANLFRPLTRRDSILSRVTRGLVKAAKFVLPLVLPALLAYFVGVPPAFAKSKRSRRSGSTALDAAAAAAAAAATAVVAPPKKRTLLQKILQGVNADGASIIKGAGDTRGEFAAILNAFSSVFILSGLFAVAFVVHKQREVKMDRAMAREVEKVREYKENMYFEAVQSVLEKLADPKLKGSTKANLQKQLKDLDPDGVIKKFLEEKGERPDISYLTDRKKKKKSQDKFSAIAERKPKKKPSPSAVPKKSPSSSSSLRDDDDAEDDTPQDDSSPPASAVAASRQPAHKIVLQELSESLQSVLSDKQRKQLVDYLQAKIESVEDPAKRDAVVAKIAQRLGDDEYWEAYAQKL